MQKSSTNILSQPCKQNFDDFLYWKLTWLNKKYVYKRFKLSYIYIPKNDRWKITSYFYYYYLIVQNINVTNIIFKNFKLKILKLIPFIEILFLSTLTYSQPHRSCITYNLLQWLPLSLKSQVVMSNLYLPQSEYTRVSKNNLQKLFWS